MKTLTILTLAGALTGFSALGQGTPAPETTAPPHRHFAGALKEVLSNYDVNQDAQLDAAEYAALIKDIDEGKIVPPGLGGPRPMRGPGFGGGMRHGPEVMAKYDTNNDGQLDEAERAVLHQDIEDGKVQPPPGRGFGRGQGMGTRTPPADILEKYDANKDGQLDETERAALHQDIQDGKVTPPMRRGRK